MQLPINELTAVEEVENEMAKIADQRIALDASEVITTTVKNGDIDRLMTGANLVNAFNYAIQQQAKREEWTANDYRAFCVALAAMNEIK